MKTSRQEFASPFRPQLPSCVERMANIAHEHDTRSNMSPQRLVERAKSTITPATMNERCEWYRALSLHQQNQVRLWLETWVLPDLDYAAVKLKRRKVARHA